MKHMLNRGVAASLVLIAMLLAAPHVRAEITDIADIPLANAPKGTVLPNLMYILDDSGSMQSDYMPNEVSGAACKYCSSVSTCVASGAYCSTSTDSTVNSGYADPPYFSNDFNQIYYNPKISYVPAVTSTGISYPNQPATAAKNDPFGVQYSGTSDLTTTFPDVYYCRINNPTAAQYADASICRRNGINNVGTTPTTNYFLYYANGVTAGTVQGGYPNATGSAATSFIYRKPLFTGKPYYFTISPHEYCSDPNLVNCALANPDGTAPSGYGIPAPLRYCKLAANSALTTAVSDTAAVATPKCRKKYDASTYPYPRYGRFRRVDIIPASAPFPKPGSAKRPDCLGSNSCTYNEEIQNFANWYSYYSNRLNMMKTASGLAFLSIDDSYRVGFITINPNNPVTASKYLPIAKFSAGTGSQKDKFYSLLYAQTTNGSTPLRQALARVGRHYAGVTTGINAGMPQDPVQYSCQKNFSLLTSDGYWNDSDSDAISLTNAAVGNQDNTPSVAPSPIFVSRGTGTLDGVGTKFKNDQPTTITEQNLCTGSANTNFSGTAQTACGCVGGQTRIKQRTIVQTTTTTGTDDIPNAPVTTPGTVTFTTFTSCGPATSTVVTPVTRVEQQVVIGAASTSFAAINGVPATNIAGSCPAGQRRAMQRTTTWNSTVVITAGVPAAASISGTAYAPIITIGSCAASATAAATMITNGTPVTTVNSGTAWSTADITLNPNPTVSPGTQTSTITPGGTPNTLADVAMYYYKTDLRPSGPLAGANVPATAKDINTRQHMVTYTLGLGLTGLMDYIPDYETNAAGDLAKIKNGFPGCSWTTGTCNWPTPTSGANTTLDDLWHAAVNGRGVYYSASDPSSLATSLGSALSDLNGVPGAASASATSSPNITPSDNFIYSSTFQTVEWYSQIQARKINPDTGALLATGTFWEAGALLDGRVSNTSDTRQIFTFSPLAPGKLKPFLWSSLSSGEQSIFANRCAGLSQCVTLSGDNQVIADDGQNLVNFLRGQKQYANGGSASVYRTRAHTLGDAVNAAPVYVRAPVFNFNDAVTPTYATFKKANATLFDNSDPPNIIGGRQSVLYVAANDGMLHAFDGQTGAELWAYVPRMAYAQLPGLASVNWSANHQFIVDGTPQVMDVFDGSASAWKTILVAGLGAGGRGYYALDITDPNNPKGLWETCSDASLCAASDSDMGYSLGYPVISKRPTDGKWVALVTSGMNNVSPGTGRGYLYVLDALTGAILTKVDTGAGDTTTPSGFAKISGFANNYTVDNTVLYVYGGDLLGNLWRFDMSAASPAVLKLAMLKDSTGRPQSITTRPELSTIGGSRIVFVGTGRYLGPSDLKDPATLSPALPWAWQQSFYAIKDRNIALGNIRTSSPGLVQQTLSSTSDVTRTTSNNPVDWTTRDGWYVDFNPANSSPGERVNLDPQLVLGTLLVATAVPIQDVCKDAGGDSWLYQFNFKSGTFIPSAGTTVAQKKVNSLTVGIVVVVLPNGKIVAEVTNSTGGQEPIAVSIGSGSPNGKRVSWRELIQ